MPSDTDNQPETPLGNCRVILTRPYEKHCDLTRLLAQWGAETIHLPLVETRSIPFAMPDLKPIDWLLFTSRSAVHQVGSWLATYALTEPLPPIAVVGPKTEEALNSYGLHASFVPQRFDATSAMQEWLSTHGKPGQTLLWFRGNLANEQWLYLLTTAQIKVESLVVYETAAVSHALPTDSSPGRYDHEVWVFTSPSAVIQAKEQNWFPQPWTILAGIGPSTAKALNTEFGRCDVQPDRHTLEDLAYALRNHLSTGIPPR